MRLALIGYGSIGQSIAGHLTAQNNPDELVGVLVRTAGPAREGTAFVTRIEDLLELRPTVVIEAAGHEAIQTHGPLILRSGIDLVVSSVGALASQELTDGLIEAQSAGAGHVRIPSGAVAGLDGLIAARIAGLDHVLYTSYKPPNAWRGTVAERTIDLDHGDDEVTFFEGSARTAARQFPKNANVSAAIALAGIGFDRTHVRLVSSRKVSGPLGVIEASGNFGWFDFKIFAHAFPGNPKTSMLSAYSLLQTARFGVGIPLIYE